MGVTQFDLARVAEYEERRAAIMNRYTPRLKSLSATDPQRAEVWNARATALQALAKEYTMPAEGGA